jgi:hypothetical protein
MEAHRISVDEDTDSGGVASSLGAFMTKAAVPKLLRDSDTFPLR